MTTAGDPPADEDPEVSLDVDDAIDGVLVEEEPESNDEGSGFLQREQTRELHDPDGLVREVRDVARELNLSEKGFLEFLGFIRESEQRHIELQRRDLEAHIEHVKRHDDREDLRVKSEIDSNVEAAKASRENRWLTAGIIALALVVFGFVVWVTGSTDNIVAILAAVAVVGLVVAAPIALLRMVNEGSRIDTDKLKALSRISSSQSDEGQGQDHKHDVAEP